jgi:hypothetical protein
MKLETDVNPYRAAPGIDQMVGSRRNFLNCSLFTFLLFLIGSTIRLIVTWEAYKLDGSEQFGFPLTLFERGGFSFQTQFYLWNAMLNLLCACVVAVVLHCITVNWNAKNTTINETSSKVPESE